VFGPEPATAPAAVATADGAQEETLELLARLRRSDVDAATLDLLTITVDRLCSDYRFMPSTHVRREGLAWIARLNALLDARLTLHQHREILVLAGWLTLLVGCVEYDMLRGGEAENARRAALALGREAGHADIEAWSHEMRSWFALTQGRYQEVIEAARQGRAVAGGRAVAVQLAAQEAKAWARMGDRRHVELALEHGRSLLESLPYPDNVQNHFTVDPDKFDFYAMDCYRRAGEDAQASLHATEVIRKHTAPEGTDRSPMRVAEAEITLAVVAARMGDLEQAVDIGSAALDIPRRSVPSLVMVGRELATELTTRFGAPGAATPYLERWHELARSDPR
jgi:tetratricopeptide (TPR) repeat protein